MKRHTGFSAVIFFSLIFSVSCSLKYDTGIDVDEIIPEFSFTDSVMTRYEKKKKNVEMKVGQLEQFKDGHSMYAKDVVFSLFEDGDVSMEGSCSYLGADTKAEIYEMFESIKLYRKKDDVRISGRSFHWNGKTEQLTAGRNDTVAIEKDGMTVRGSGFSASGASSSFAFNSIVTGNIETKDE